jgi:hypothetical protein
MPIQSKAQQRFLFATHPEMAKEWAKETPDMKSLPEKKHPSVNPKGKKLDKEASGGLFFAKRAQPKVGHFFRDLPGRDDGTFHKRADDGAESEDPEPDLSMNTAPVEDEEAGGGMYGTGSGNPKSKKERDSLEDILNRAGPGKTRNAVKVAAIDANGNAYGKPPSQANRDAATADVKDVDAKPAYAQGSGPITKPSQLPASEPAKPASNPWVRASGMAAPPKPDAAATPKPQAKGSPDGGVYRGANTASAAASPMAAKPTTSVGPQASGSALAAGGFNVGNTGGMKPVKTPKVTMGTATGSAPQTGSRPGESADQSLDRFQGKAPKPAGGLANTTLKPMASLAKTSMPRRASMRDLAKQSAAAPSDWENEIGIPTGYHRPTHDQPEGLEAGGERWFSTTAKPAEQGSQPSIRHGLREGGSLHTSATNSPQMGKHASLRFLGTSFNKQALAGDDDGPSTFSEEGARNLGSNVKNSLGELGTRALSAADSGIKSLSKSPAAMGVAALLGGKALLHGGKSVVRGTARALGHVPVAKPGIIGQGLGSLRKLVTGR